MAAIEPRILRLAQRVLVCSQPEREQLRVWGVERVRVVRYGEDTFKLERMRDLLARLGNPHEQVRSVHVAGTNGKGSTSAMIAGMLQECGYTWELKQRISSTHGHLCNEAAGQLIEDIMHPELFHIVLGHLSENSNTPTLALECARRYLERCDERGRGLRTLLCGNVYESLPSLHLDERCQAGVINLA
jgi:hypothetical protein